MWPDPLEPWQDTEQSPLVPTRSIVAHRLGGKGHRLVPLFPGRFLLRCGVIVGNSIRCQGKEENPSLTLFLKLRSCGEQMRPSSFFVENPAIFQRL
jgi:hypothetical protein